ncbi:MAG: hypothetical protein JW889_12335 [Verrucomicrobia bacterium]|nr:hypothetical protein [Verrucomicrobiota bacterium]
MARGLFCLFGVVVIVLLLAPAARGQFLSDEERRGMFTVGVSYSSRDYEMEYRGSTVPIPDLEAVFEAFTTDLQLDTIELSIAWLSFGYIELRGTVALADFELTSTHGTDSAFNTAFATSDDFLYGLSAIVRYPITESVVLGFEVSMMTGTLNDVEGEVSQLDVVPRVTTSVADIDWRELVIGPKVMFRMGNWLPYVGVRYIDVTTEVNTVLTPVRGDPVPRTATFDSRNELSGVVGVTWRISSLFVADVEAQIANNNRITATVKLTF